MRPDSKSLPPPKTGKSIDAVSVESIGTVLGVRSAGDWTFYVQRNLLVCYLHNSAPDVAGITWGSRAFVLGVEEFWPNQTLGRAVPTLLAAQASYAAAPAHLRAIG